VEKEALEFLKSETKKMYSGLLKSGDTKAMEDIGGTIAEFDTAGSHLLLLIEIKKRAINRREFAVLSIAEFLWAFEGFYICRLDLYCLLLIANGHDLFDPIRRKYVTSLKEVGMVDVSTKLIFLDEHGLGMLRRKTDQKLRNGIAHHQFSIKDNGDILIGSQVVDMNSAVDNLLDFIRIINSALLEGSAQSGKG